MHDTITILVATMSGTAEMLADDLADKLAGAGLTARVRRMDEIQAADIAPGLYLVCSSTYGVGEIPANGQALYDALQASRPDLDGVRYGVISLGDSLYPQTFCFGGRHFDELLAALGAQRIGTRLEHDTRSGRYPEDAAAEWLETWLPQASLAQPC
ncbi:Sulfite reductase [NADPH] flavoprotein alpha-component [Pigmentiphaga humi]|uniref:Sulfite reductase [NADPH] flavoprotein alpha-component n=1 Tax=Pigmentiphaga humi TaxID=2478468 RepID=A0A3P4B8J9_9BURK|nr:flavodoxin domain-containing protein [Pigmentiphaga humi]VCU71485.1 Sulfite reductase [NADPH] flavoprotein alpha-component [Pigmentiphaga humi]